MLILLLILTFFSGSSSFVLNSITLVLFEAIFLLKIISLLSKSVFFTKSVISGILVLLAKFVYFNLAAKLSSPNLLNY